MRFIIALINPSKFQNKTVAPQISDIALISCVSNKVQLACGVCFFLRLFFLQCVHPPACHFNRISATSPAMTDERCRIFIAICKEKGKPAAYPNAFTICNGPYILKLWDLIWGRFVSGGSRLFLKALDESGHFVSRWQSGQRWVTLEGSSAYLVYRWPGWWPTSNFVNMA